SIRHIGSRRGPYDLESLLAQQSQANTAIWQYINSYLATFISAVALVCLTISLRLTKQALSDTREIGEAQTTCYIHASNATWGANNNIIIHCENSGLTPASNFSVSGKCYLAMPGSISSSIVFEEWPLKHWSALASHSTLKVSLDELDTDVIQKFKTNQQPKGTTFVIIGSIYYKSVFGKTFRTQFAFFNQSNNPQANFRRPTSNLEVHK
ncbi:hypothetical protein HBA94_17010, partial [Ochrobactrum sp. GRS2]|nr:hypothetical protein [Ochrobactrum sp. GRS2]